MTAQQPTRPTRSEFQGYVDRAQRASEARECHGDHRAEPEPEENPHGLDGLSPADKKLVKSGVGRRFALASLDSYIPKGPGQAKALAACRDLVGPSCALAQGEGLLLWGPPGTGKTHLLVGMLRAAVDKSLSVKYLPLEWFFIGLRDSMHSHGDKGEAAYLRALCAVDVLAVDDLHHFAADDAAYQRRMLFTLADTRYADKRPLLLASNRVPEQINGLLEERERRRFNALPVEVPQEEGKA